ncbi:MAG: SCO family protein [Planctomycetota bacterium]|nr:MAG: SCO family protein [Planctomycetota bacterium]
MTAGKKSPAPPSARFAAWTLETLRGWRFPSFMIFTLSFAQLVLLALLFVPPAETGLGAFAESFKTWCFGYDPATGEVEPGYVIMLLANPFLLDLVILGVWWIPLREVLRERPRALLRSAGAAALVTALFAGALASFAEERPRGPLPFPAEELRIALTPPDFELTDQEGAPVSLHALRGRVVLVTAVYATCGFTCPMIMGQSKRALAELTPEEREEITVVGITLDPAHDTPEVLARMAEGQGVAAPLYRLVTGPPPEVERVLDRFGVERHRNPETGIIDHANLFLLIDRRGRIAYRLSLGDQQERWLATALRLLVREPSPTAEGRALE